MIAIAIIGTSDGHGGPQTSPRPRASGGAPENAFDQWGEPAITTSRLSPSATST